MGLWVFEPMSEDSESAIMKSKQAGQREDHLQRTNDFQRRFSGLNSGLLT